MFIELFHESMQYWIKQSNVKLKELNLEWEKRNKKNGYCFK